MASKWYLRHNKSYVNIVCISDFIRNLFINHAFCRFDIFNIA